MRRPGRSSEIPPPLELACLQTLWQLGEGSVKDVREGLAQRNLAYTTVMTVLDRLARRGAVARRKKGRAFLYAPVMGREQTREIAVKELVHTHFDGSTRALREYLDNPQPARAGELEDSMDPTLL